MASLFAPLNREVTVEVESWPNEAAMMATSAPAEGRPRRVPRLRRDLLWLTQHQIIQPIDQLLDDRGVDFGDDYPRSTLTRSASTTASTACPTASRPRSSSTTSGWSSSAR